MKIDAKLDNLRRKEAKQHASGRLIILQKLHKYEVCLLSVPAYKLEKLKF